MLCSHFMKSNANLKYQIFIIVSCFKWSPQFPNCYAFFKESVLEKTKKGGGGSEGGIEIKEI